MNKINFMYLAGFISISLVGYIIYIYAFNGIRIVKKNIQQFKSDINRVGFLINALEHLHKHIKKDVLYVDKEKNRLINWGKQLDDREEMILEYEIKINEQKNKSDEDLRNCRANVKKLKKQLE